MDGGDYTVVWKPQPRQLAFIRCPVFEIFFGGARGGGKTDASIGDFAVHGQQYGEHAIGLMVRRTLEQLKETIERSRQIFAPLGAKLTEDGKLWRFPNGARLRFAYLERDQDADNYQGHSYSRVYIEEIGNFPSPVPIMKLMATLRSGAGVPCGFRATGNPGGPGHQWVKARYIDPAPLGWEILTSEFTNPFNGEKVGRDRVYIPSRLDDNRYLGADYVANLHLSGNAELVLAWLEGEWAVISGAVFPEWYTQKHVIRPVTLPKDWTRFRSMDWGSAKPFSVGWWAISDGAMAQFPRGALIRYREWYGQKDNEPNVGLRMPANEVGQGIVSRETGEHITYGVLDPAAWASDGGPSIAERLNEAGAKQFRRADNARVQRLGAMGGWDQLRQRLVGDGERPMLYVFDTCRDLIRTLPALQHDPNRPEDVDTQAEDHAPDECRYACMSRPWVPENKPVKEPIFRGLSIGQQNTPNAPTIDQIWQDHAKNRDFGE
mgnify:CR=1 FL=1